MSKEQIYGRSFVVVPLPPFVCLASPDFIKREGGGYHLVSYESKRRNVAKLLLTFEILRIFIAFVGRMNVLD